MLSSTKGRLVLVAATVTAVLIGGGIAVAFWTTTGTGTGSAATGTSTAVTLTTVNPVAGLYPGIAAQPVDFTITNPGTAPVRVATVSFTVTGSTPAGCLSPNFALTQPTLATPVDVAGGATVTVAWATSGAAIAMLNLPTNQDVCKNVTVNLSFTAG